VTFHYFTVISAYLVAAYAVGRNLTLNQVLMISVLFIAISGSSTLALVAQVDKLLELAQLRRETFPDSPLQASTAATKGAYIFAGIQVAGIFAALTFMWKIRRQN